jgi:hypothetical protein
MYGLRNVAINVGAIQGNKEPNISLLIEMLGLGLIKVEMQEDESQVVIRPGIEDL